MSFACSFITANISLSFPSTLICREANWLQEQVGELHPEECTAAPWTRFRSPSPIIKWLNLIGSCHSRSSNPSRVPAVSTPLSTWDQEPSFLYSKSAEGSPSVWWLSQRNHHAFIHQSVKAFRLSHRSSSSSLRACSHHFYERGNEDIWATCSGSWLWKGCSRV